MSGLALESELDPTRYGYDLSLLWRDEDFVERNYGEGKRQAESALTQSAAFPVAIGRVAHVLSHRDEFTGRVQFLVDRIREGRRIASFREPGRTSLVHGDDLGRFLAWLAQADLTGPVNVCSAEPVTLYDVCAPFEVALGRGARIEEVDNASDDPDLAPFSYPADFGMSPELAERAGFRFPPTHEWLRALAEAVSAEMRG
ncbi:MAG TPA: hypothetical protein VHJ83_08130, partial [Micromonosporaceae bacterium]|jgi:hypothetical protein|nr:hypothetical protein [Micromonosporaceae bacterium]